MLYVVIRDKITVRDFKTSPVWISQFPNASDRFRCITFLQIYKDRMLPDKVAPKNEPCDYAYGS